MHPEYFKTRFRTPEPIDSWPADFSIISAYATTGETWTPAQNEDADLKLQQALAERSPWVVRVEGYSPTTSHAEPGWAVKLSASEACEIGREYKQDAIYYVKAGKLSVILCNGKLVHVTVDEFSNRLD